MANRIIVATLYDYTTTSGGVTTTTRLLNVSPRYLKLNSEDVVYIVIRKGNTSVSSLTSVTFAFPSTETDPFSGTTGSTSVTISAFDTVYQVGTVSNSTNSTLEDSYTLTVSATESSNAVSYEEDPKMTINPQDPS